MMILHYLGLDHIGHLEGPFSSKISWKLNEMDGIIKLIYLQLEKWVNTIVKHLNRDRTCFKYFFFSLEYDSFVFRKKKKNKNI